LQELCSYTKKWTIVIQSVKWKYRSIFYVNSLFTRFHKLIG